MKIISDKECIICKRKDKKLFKFNNENYCYKHYSQMKRFGEIIDDSARTVTDKNEIFIEKDFAKIALYDKRQTEITDFCIIDKDDIDKCKKYKWTKHNAEYAFNSTNNMFLHRYILGLYDDNVKKQVDHINGDRLDNRKSNLRLCTQVENCRNARYNKNKSKCNIIGVRKDIRCINSWRAQIYFNRTKHIEKTFKDKELAIIQRLIWELIYFKDFAPQIELIKTKYPYLLGINKITEMTFNSDIKLIKELGDSLIENPHCPCMIKQTDDTICPCLPCRSKQYCRCGMFVKTEIDD